MRKIDKIWKIPYTLMKFVELLKTKVRWDNRQYSYSPMALGREPSEHECEANAGNFARNYKETYGKLQLGCRKTSKLKNALNI